ncbi:MAG: hypothetical protein AAF899_17260 [Pseudomonadota bacterium]
MEWASYPQRHDTVLQAAHRLLGTEWGPIGTAAIAECHGEHDGDASGLATTPTRGLPQATGEARPADTLAQRGGDCDARRTVRLPHAANALGDAAAHSLQATG